MLINEIIVRPILTEKATNHTKNSTYMFEVNRHANAYQIKEALTKLYQVKIKDIRVLIRKGKEKRTGKRMKTKILPDIKIAYIVLKEGKFDLFPQT
ncbi:MAG: 50S ribosomal protein L23 [Candidatus Roizmanbacteria bacterium GW2011_GWA2_36_23]|uniref:Large ribosomal subunit protein uL23 n=1 Tax=Candidatus Roizmanbacteria bacterium GW2011_GWA2_36_23 TaxID=1618480 RepID=A0A0G0HE09_9BACT|nr:MAG: 50S ribosomal protein L23 [Candidatus Roizmanbacteria bacterium GW2011_GWA2_36_23]